MLDGVDREVDVEPRPAQVSRMRTLDLENLADRGVQEPGAFRVGKEELAIVDEDPEAVLQCPPAYAYTSV